MSILSSPEYVSAGSRMTWTGQFGANYSYHLTLADVIQAAASVLSNNYLLAVERNDNGVSWGGLGSGSITLSLRTDQDRGDGETDDGLTDILNNVSDAFKQVGYPPINAVINNYTPADNSGRGTINTGTPLKTVPQQEADKPKDNSPSWWDQLVSKVEAGSIGFALGGIAVVALIVVVVVHSET